MNSSPLQRLLDRLLDLYGETKWWHFKAKHRLKKRIDHTVRRIDEHENYKRREQVLASFKKDNSESI